MQASAASVVAEPTIPARGDTVMLRADLGDLGPQHSEREVTLVSEIRDGVWLHATRAGWTITVGRRVVRRSYDDGGHFLHAPLTNFQRGLLAA